MIGIIADEDVERPIVRRLRNRGVEVFYVDEEMKGADDEIVAEKSLQMERPVLTFDRRFDEDVEEHYGVLHVKSEPSYAAVVEAVVDVVTRLNHGSLYNEVIPVSPSGYAEL